MTDPQGNAAPAGGFKQGGWYSGSQYWDGTFSAPGQFNSLNNQPGQSGGAAPVQNATDAAYLTKLGDTTASSRVVSGQSGITPYLNDYQNNLLGSLNSPDVKGVQSFSDIQAGLTSSGLLPSGQAPVAPNMEQKFGELSNAKGLDAISASITDLKSQQDAIASQLQVTKTAEKGKPVAQNVIEGRISQEQQQSQDQYDFIGRQLARKQDEYNSALGNIKMIMDFAQTDFNNASTSYNTQFSQAISTFNLIHGIQQDQKTDVQKATDNARANLQIMMNAITSGNLSLGSLAPDQQVQLNKLEVQSGLPIGFMQSLQMDPKSKIISTTESNGVISVLSMGANGQPVLNKYGTSTAGGSAAGGSAFNTAVQQGIADLKQGEQWGTVWARIHSQFPGVDASLIDNGLGIEWRQPGAYQNFKSNQQSVGGASGQDQAYINQIKDDLKNGLYSREEAAKLFPEYAQYF